MRDEHYQGQERSRAKQWIGLAGDGETPAVRFVHQVVLETVDARAGSASTRRVFRGRLRNQSDVTIAVTLEVTLPPPFLPSAPVLMRRPFTIAPGESLRVELGSTVGAEPSADEVREAVQLQVA